MRNIWLNWVALAVLAVIAVMPASADDTKLKLAHALSSTSHYGAGASAFANSLETISKGKFIVEKFPDNILGSEHEVIEGLQSGNIDLAVISTSAVMDLIPEIGMFDIPFLMHDLQHARNVLDGPIGKNILSKFPEKGIVALAWGEQGFRHLTNNVRPVLVPEDARGLKIRTPQNSIHVSGFSYIGILPVPMTLTDAIKALKDGSIDGQENPLSVIIATQMDNMQKYLSLTGHVYAPALILVSSKLYKQLSSADKKFFQKSGRAACLKMRDFVDDIEKRSLDRLRKEGMQVTEVERASFAMAMEPVYAEFYKKFDKRIIDAIPFQRKFQ
ncbi:TRAP-type C4-dicarboxylate transport system, periplasmic component [Candidatus Kinetoplastibacterium oncopeltii TCC290E]|uniref:TRAP-type C4-dicarboxylate transport system, periplasmic component n=1 Tax=Candidatus Kinetoplastidibacterium stringomonadis TCC290E TaxID=1208920 RepID=M1LRN1_9PROT|nr:TRAP transporter substrate-binding protein DctP [Candidatus Kinetoplastibacterium oncopeltii]AGF48202.1 TRAP-type C4-dicarboxylate transport system, periplasmic component [Candidatus Kinetoplastibacterium oncopeltii TCC290E]